MGIGAAVGGDGEARAAADAGELRRWERERCGGRSSGGQSSGEERRGLRHGHRPGRGGRSGEDDGGARSGGQSSGEEEGLLDPAGAGA